jgi:hypothetical protein
MREKMNYSSRFFLYAPLLAFLSLAAWAMGYWWVVASALDKKLIALNGHEAVPGITVSYASKSISGFPFNIDVVFTGLKIAGAGAHGPFSWSSPNFALHTLTYGPRKYIYEAAGQQNLTWTDGAGAAHRTEFLPGALRASAQTDQKGLSRFDLELVAAAGKNFTAAHLQFHLRRDPDRHDLDLMTTADDVKTDDGKTGPLSAWKVYATLTNEAALLPLLRGEASWPQAVTAWHAAGGRAKYDAQLLAPAGTDAAVLFNPLY